MVVGINGNFPGEHIAGQHVTGKIGPRNRMPSGGGKPPKKGFFARLFSGCLPVLFVAFGSVVLGIAGLVDIFGSAA